MGSLGPVDPRFFLAHGAGRNGRAQVRQVVGRVEEDGVRVDEHDRLLLREASLRPGAREQAVGHGVLRELHVQLGDVTLDTEVREGREGGLIESAFAARLDAHEAGGAVSPGPAAKGLEEEHPLLLQGPSLHTRDHGQRHGAIIGWR